MSLHLPRTALVLGGIRSGKSEFAESLVSDTPTVRYVATARARGPAGEDDHAWRARLAAHQARRPEAWTTEEVGAPADLIAMIAAAGPDDTLLVDDVGNWVAAMIDPDFAGPDATNPGATDPGATDLGIDSTAAIEALAAAVAATAARVVLVSPEVGLSVVPATPIAMAFADVNGGANQALAAVCEGVALVVAGQATWLKTEPSATSPVPGAAPASAAIPAAIPDDAAATSPVAASITVTPPAVTPAMVTSTVAPMTITPTPDDADEDHPARAGMTLPRPDATAAADALSRAARVPVSGAGLGSLASLVSFAAGAAPERGVAPYTQIRVVVVTGVSAGAVGTGGGEERRRERAGGSASSDHVLACLASGASVPAVAIEVVDAGRAAPIEDGDAIDTESMDVMIRRGWAVAQAAADRGDELIVLAAAGPGVDGSAAAVVAGITRGEIAGLLGRVYTGDGSIDDDAWIERCLVIRDTLHRVKPRIADGRNMLAAVGGPAIAFATGLILGAADRRTPVMIDGPVGAAGALVARDYATEVRLWLLLADDGGHPAVRVCADLLGLTPAFRLGIGLGEGGASLATLPLIQSALALSAMAG